MSWGCNQSRSGEVSQGESGSQRPVLPWPELSTAWFCYHYLELAIGIPN